MCDSGMSWLSCCLPPIAISMIFESFLCLQKEKVLIPSLFSVGNDYVDDISLKGYFKLLFNYCKYIC